MTKTPEELTEDWKAGKLEQDKDYYVETMACDVVIDFYGQLYDDCPYPQGLGFDNVSNGFVKRILAPVPTYDEYKAMQDQIANLSKEVEEQKNDNGYAWHTAGIESDKNDELRTLLKECKNIVAHDCWQEAQFPDGQIVERQDLLTRINAALGCNETQANPVADIKIQGSEEK